jgi:hypothetical protein
MTITRHIPVNSIATPVSFQRAIVGWTGGTDCMLYAVSSTGGLTIGTRRPRGCDSDEKWYLQIWRELSIDLDRAACAAEKGLNGPEDADDAFKLREYEAWVDYQIGRLERSYGLADWDICDD